MQCCKCGGADLPQPDLKLVGQIPALLAVDTHRVPVEIDFAANRPITCACCEGTGLVTVTKCDDCDGKGEFDHGRHTYECENCDATGEVRRTAEQGDKSAEACPECLGTCYASKTITITVGPVKHAYQEKYLRLFAEWPNARLLLSPTDHNESGLFLFDGGRGLVMPMQC